MVSRSHIAAAASVLALLGMLAACSGDGAPPCPADALAEEIDTLAACSPEDVCIVIEASECLCSYAINEAQVDELESLLQSAECAPGCPRPSCAEVDGAECVDGLCTAILRERPGSP